MNIVHIITTIEFGGAEKQLLTLVLEQVKEGHKVHVIPLKGRLEMLNSFVDAGANTNPKLIKKSPVFQILFLTKIVSAIKPDIVHAHLPRAELLASLIAKRINLVVTKHNAETFLPKGSKHISKLLANWVSYRTRAVITISHYVKYFLNQNSELRFPQKTYVVHYGFRNNTDYIKKPIKLKTQSLKIVCVSRLAKQKNIESLIRSLEICNKDKLIFSLSVFGEGPLENDLKKITTDLGIENRVCWMGKTKNIEMKLLDFDLLILPSLYEGFGLVLLEAMQVEIPVLASNNSAIPEVLGSDYDGLFNTSDYAQLAKLIKHSYSKRFRNKLLSQLQRRAQFFSSQEMERKIACIYLRVLS